MLKSWQNKGMFKVSEQHLVDQARAIQVDNWLTSVKLEDFKRKVCNLDGETDASGDLGNEPVQMNRPESTEKSGLRAEPLQVSDVASISERQRAIIEHIRKVLQEEGKGNLVSLERIERNKLTEFVKEVNDVLGHIKNSNITA